MTDRPRVVIVGGGFGGLYAAKALRRAPVDVLLIDRNNYHLFQPLLYQVATGSLSETDIAAPLRWVLRRQGNATVLLGEVLDIDAETREVLLRDRRIRYDFLILAAGAARCYFGREVWRSVAPSLKDLQDASQIRSRIFCALEAAEKARTAEERREWLTFVVIGAGPTGVELAGALAEIARDTLRNEFRRIHQEETRILLVDLAHRVLPAFPERLSARAKVALRQLGIEVLLDTAVEEIHDDEVIAHSPQGRIRIAPRTVLWAAGVSASPLARALQQRAGAQLDRTGRVLVAEDCSLPGHPEIFVVGDMAAFRQADGTVLPGLAPVAMQQGEYVARRIIGCLRGEEIGAFHYRNKGILAVIGRRRAVAAFGRLRIGGALAWLLWLFVHLMYLVGFQNRVLVLIQWGFHYFTRNRRARLILDRGPYCPDWNSISSPDGSAPIAAQCCGRLS